MLKLDGYHWFCGIKNTVLSSEFWARQAQREVVKIKNLDFSYWAWRTPWGHVLSLKTFCRNPALSWAIRYSVFQLVKFTSNFEFVCGTLFSTFWRNPVLSWAIRYSVFQKVKFTSNFEFVCGNLFSTFWHLMVKFGYIRWF